MPACHIILKHPYTLYDNFDSCLFVCLFVCFCFVLGVFSPKRKVGTDKNILPTKKKKISLEKHLFTLKKYSNIKKNVHVTMSKIC